MCKGQSFVRQYHHGSRHVVHCNHLAVLHHFANAFASGRSVLESGPGLDEVAAQAQAQQTGGRLHIQHTGSHLRGWLQTQGLAYRVYTCVIK